MKIHSFPSSFYFQTHTVNNENSAEAESHHNAKYHCQVEVDEDEEDKVEEVIPPVKDQADEANRRLAEDEEHQLEHKDLVQPGQNVLLDFGNGRKVVEENEGGEWTCNDAENRHQNKY